jgi:CheY-like chemotaxis protein
MNRYKNILLVEDDLDDRIFFTEALEAVLPSANCTIADNGQQALNLLEMFQLPDIIFLDTSLPIMNGIEFLRHIKADEFYKDIPIVVLASSRFNIEGWYDEGALLYIIKPISEDAFRTILHTVLSHDVKKDAKQLRALFSLAA